ncbi:alanine racemase [Methylobacterium dankookense]|uniref:alanine racemase n=1 Tax=Methylobacterium dankookense TaxID=560405 RepID=UPI0011A8CF4B|nr:alanine racemase [Methylobacterium dankookense]
MAFLAARSVDPSRADPLAGSAARRAGAILTIDLAAIAENYRFLRRQAGRATCAAVVKADAYGLGAARVAPTLARAGCRDFFVAHLEEGIALRAILGRGPRIAILHGAPAGTETDCLAEDLVPVLNDLEQVAAWRALARRRGEVLPAILQVDTGMARFGLPRAGLDRLLAEPDGLAGLSLGLVMSHLACADAPDHPANADQRAAFASLRARLPGVPASLAASSGIFLGPEFQADLVRPGAALYGVNPQPGRPNPMRPVVRLQARILQLRDVAAGDGVGYGHAAVAHRPMRLAVVAAGYADGYLRSASGRGMAFAGPHPLAGVGRVSMDSLILDVTDVPPDAVPLGGFVDLIGPGHGVDALAEAAGTIGYEVLTSLGSRYHRIYREA